MAFTYKLELQDGTPADPPILRTAVPTWNTGDRIPLGDGRTLEVVDERWGDAEPVLKGSASRADKKGSSLVTNGREL